ncbi:MAG TPA: ROK family transcriptional regulator, partial [Candidatus Ornithocaccomicrobium faecavium]|nr:ROK family transcriptional regulator [Candidatus Ornithocaccomicrobium faecavium]
MGPIRIRDQSYIKQKNIESILGVLEACQPISRAEISRLTDMSPASITRIVNALLSLGLVSEGSVALSAGRGRRAINLRIRPDGMHTLGVCMESGRVRLGVMDFAGNLAACQETRLPAPPASPEEAANVARTLFASLGPASQWPSLAAVGVSVPGMVDNESGHVSRSDELGWTDVSLTQPFAQAFGLPAWAENDVKACLVGERAVRGIPEEEDVAYLLVGTGLGLAISAGGRILRGAGNAAGEIHGLPFGDGTLSDYLVERNLLRRARETAPAVRSLEDIVHACEQGADWAVTLMDSALAAMRV